MSIGVDEFYNGLHGFRESIHGRVPLPPPINIFPLLLVDYKMYNVVSKSWISNSKENSCF